MKKRILTIALILVFVVASTVLYAQGPPPPPVDPETGGGPVGGSAPVGNGMAVLLTLAAAYGYRKASRLKQKDEIKVL